MGIVRIVTSIIIVSILTQIQKNEGSSNIKTLHLNISSDGRQSTTLSRFLPITVLIITLTSLAIYWNFGSKFYLGATKLHQANLAINSDLGASFQKQIEAQRLNQYDSTYSILLSNTYQQVALFYLQKQNPSEADKRNSTEMMQRSIDAGRIAAQIDPFNVMVWENLSGIYQSFIGAAEGATNLAISHLAQAISLDPTNPKLRLQLGILYYNLQDKEQAIKLINQAIELKPNWSLPYQNLYRVYLEEKDTERAKIYLQEAIKYTENNSEDFQKLQEELINLNQKTN
jgi:tetratricopeptide (TPR) repeat protein